MPTRPPLHSADADLEALHRISERLGGFDDRVSIDWIDGYLTALLAGPRAVGMEEWLPVMFGDTFERTFGDPEDAAQARAALHARWRVLADQLDAEALLDEPDALRLSPLMTDFGEAMQARLKEDGATDEELATLPLTGEEWAHGFMAAVHAFPQDWPEPDVDTPDGMARDDLTMRVIALTITDDDELAEYLAEAYPDDTLDRDDLIDEACLAVQDLRIFWVDHAPKPPTRRVDATPGRNDPCPCGSGRKYKKCHGAQ